MKMTKDELIYISEQLRKYETEDRKLKVRFFLGCEMVPQAITNKMILDKRANKDEH